MECSGKTLEKFLDESSGESLTRLNFEQRTKMAYQIIRGLKVLHETHRLIHRDLSLSTIHVSSDGTVKIGDLGWASESKEIFQEGLTPPAPLKRPASFQELSTKVFLLEPRVEQKEDLGIMGNYTNLFMAPEQEIKKIYSQKADIYSLGLILLVLFYPTKNVSERLEVVEKCKTEGPPKDFIKSHKDLAKLIQQMVSIEPSIRPSVGRILAHPFFRFYQKHKAGERSSSLTKVENKCEEILKGEFRVTFGCSSEWKMRFLHLNGKKLLIYKRKGDAKARISYPLPECNIRPKRKLSGREKPPKRALSLFSKESAIDGASLGERKGEITEVIIEHPAIETMCLELFGTETQRSNWLQCLLNASMVMEKMKSG